MTSFKRTWSVLTLALVALTAWAQGPNGSNSYYKDANGKTGKALKTALFDIIKAPSTPGYNGLWRAYQTTDVRKDGKLRDWYSKSTNYVIGGSAQGHAYSKEGDGYNREHTIPQSWFSEASPMKSDAFHVVPSDGYVNNRRGNDPFGEVGNASYTSNGGYCKSGTCSLPGYSGRVFEPGDDIKGDLARIYFYMATCYESQIARWKSPVITGDSYQPYAKWQFDMLVRWAKNDPVSEEETARNNAVYKVQGNRNPFVDYPGLEEYVWGSKTSVPFDYTGIEGGSVTPNPGTDEPSQSGDIYNEPCSSEANTMTPENVTLTDGITYVWKVDTRYSCWKASAFVKSQKYASEAWLKTPEIDLDGYQAVTLEFEHTGKYFATPTNEATLWISVDGGAYEQLVIPTYFNNNKFDWEKPIIDLSKYAGKKIKLGFKYTSTTSSAGTWEVKNIRVFGVKSTTNGIQGVEPASMGEAPIYNLAGQRVGKSYKGIVIRNGRKYMNR